MEFDNLEIFQLRRKLHDMVSQVCQGWGPERADFETVKKDMLSYIAYKIWEKQGKPLHRDTDIWLEAENTWNFLRYMWV